MNDNSACRICLVRHGETAWNTERRLQGHIDVPLNGTGLAQAEAAARHLAGQGFAALYSSDLQRAHQTAAAIGRPHGLDAEPEHRLRERHYGLFQGLTYEEAEHRHPELYRRFKARETTLAFPEGGESLRDFADRVRAALTDIALRHRGEQVLVVTHGGVLDITHRLATGTALASPRNFPIPNAALNWIEYQSSAWRLLAWADESHLQETLDELPDA
ncbi:histidine phosphatase family protein [Thauera aromatica]|uniref:histidine phosphatase family protein n=1 Tax=Thauera aromatica TaxID=59405 RepID=UPI001FFDE166|nr:histidine phosphatase family protein [Thauera aromatica]MCK2089495.1 histidine phosphatase family protein [Thauera aromatica]